MAAGSVVLPKSGHAPCDDLATWWLSRYKISTQQTCATYPPRWTARCTRHGVHPLRAGMDRRWVHRYVTRTARAAGISRSVGPHALRRTVGTVGLNQGIPLRNTQRLLGHARPETTLASYDISPDPLERHASHQVAGCLAAWAG